jgi:two-component system CheB/CheR fusion protein
VYQDAHGAVLSVNPAAERILGLTLDQLTGRTSVDPRWQAIHEDGAPFPGDQHPAMVALRTGQPVTGVVMGVFNPQRGHRRWLHVSAIPLFRPNETQPFQVFATFNDFTELFEATHRPVSAPDRVAEEAQG